MLLTSMTNSPTLVHTALLAEPVEAAVCLLLALLLARYLWARRLETLDQQRKVNVKGLRLSGFSARPQEASSSSLPALSQAKRSKASTPWWLPSCCCSGREKDANHDSGSHVEDEDARGVLHPKWCGLRLREPSEQLPSCEAFAPERPDGALLNDWIGLGCADDERGRCQELAERVRDVDGPKDAMTLLRFLRARKQNVRRAAEQYTTAMRWRAANPVVSGFQLNTVDASLHRRFDSYWQMNGLLGRDRDGDSIMWEGIGRSVLGQSSLLPDAFFLEHQIHTCVRMEQALDEQTKLDGCPRMYFTVVEDLHGLGLKHFNRDAFRKYHKCARLSQDYFPEAIKRIIIVRPPWIFPQMWKIFKHFFDEGMRSKFVILGEHEMHAGLTKYIDSKWIPESLGGKLRVGGSPDCFPVLPPGGALVPQNLLDEVNAAFCD